MALTVRIPFTSVTARVLACSTVTRLALPVESAVASVVGRGDNWLFGKTDATVHFSVYTVTSFAGGERDVTIPYSALARFLKPDAPVR